MYLRITRLFIVALLSITSTATFSQITQTIRGTITDKTAEIPLIGAAVVVAGMTPQLEAIADNNGQFEIKNVPTGRRYSVEKGEVYQVNQIGFFPDLLWRVQF